MEPKKLLNNDSVSIIAPAYSLAIISPSVIEQAIENFKKLGLNVIIRTHAYEKDKFLSSSINSRLDDFHAAFKDKNTKAIFTAIGGYNSVQMLPHINWEIIKKNPKIFCGYSDITFLLNAIYAKTGQITYYGPHFSTLGQKNYLEYTLKYLNYCLFQKNPYIITASNYWLNDEWWMNQSKRKKRPNKGTIILQDGKAKGVIIGGHVTCFALLQGSEYLPSAKDIILIIEADELMSWEEFNRDFQSIINSKFFQNVRAILIGRFSQNTHKIKIDMLKNMLKENNIKIPTIANVDFGHTNPLVTLPIGGICLINTKKSPNILIKKH